MPIDREDTLKKAEKLLRQGRLDAAIAEYSRVVEEQPRDWATANTLGDLYVRAGQTDKAAAQYTRIAEHFMDDGFYSKAGALYKKLLKLIPEDESVLLSLAEISQRQGLLADAKAQLNAIVGRRRNRGDRAGAAEIMVRLAGVDAGDFDARTAAARMLAEMGNDEEAASRYRGIYDDLLEKGRDAEALDALREAVRLNPLDQSNRIILARTAVRAGDFEGARAYLDRETAGDDPALQLALLEMEARAGRLEVARELATAIAAKGADDRQPVIELAWVVAPSNPEAAFALVDATVDVAMAASDFRDAAALLQEFVTRVPNHIPALLKLVEVCVDGGLEAPMYEAQAQLADAYLGRGHATEARVIAEDLVAREPWERAHIERFRRALVMLKVPDPDSLIAERLSGQAPFMTTDVFAPATPQVTPPGESVEDPKYAAAESAQLLTFARTYLEMGLEDEAISSLETASKTPPCRFEAASMLGRIFQKRGDIPQAVEWLERAAEAPAPSVEDGRALLYDIGSLVEESGDTARALAVFLELLSEAGDYRDVAARVERLARVETGG